jgi:hypothetical protein
VTWCLISHAALVESHFTSDAEGWTQVNLGSDFRYLDDLTYDGDCTPHWQQGAFRCCDPDAGAWMFSAPAKFLGNLAAALDGSIAYSLFWTGEGVYDPAPYLPHILLTSNNKGIVFTFPSEPMIGVWTTNTVPLNETAGWRWVDDETPMEDLPLATREQIASVLSGVTGLWIRGEFITGNDNCWLDDVVLDGSVRAELPQLRICTKGLGRVEVSWPASATNYVLEASETPASANSWAGVNTSGQTTAELPSSGSSRFFRLKRQ